MDRLQGGLIALDLGLSLGWAALTPGRRVFSGTVKIAPHRGPAYGLRFRELRNTLAPVASAWRGSGLLAFEKVRGSMKSDDAVLSMFGMRAAALEVSAEAGWGLPVMVNPSTLKKWATGHGKASKEDMQAAARSWWKVREIGEDEADALLVLALAMRNLKLTAAFPARVGIRGGIEFKDEEE